MSNNSGILGHVILEHIVCHVDCISNYIYININSKKYEYLSYMEKENVLRIEYRFRNPYYYLDNNHDRRSLVQITPFLS